MTQACTDKRHGDNCTCDEIKKELVGLDTIMEWVKLGAIPEEHQARAAKFMLCLALTVRGIHDSVDEEDGKKIYSIMALSMQAARKVQTQALN